jgi:hypothetical protein
MDKNASPAQEIIEKKILSDKWTLEQGTKTHMYHRLSDLWCEKRGSKWFNAIKQYAT